MQRRTRPRDEQDSTNPPPPSDNNQEEELQEEEALEELSQEPESLTHLDHLDSETNKMRVFPEE